MGKRVVALSLILFLPSLLLLVTVTILPGPTHSELQVQQAAPKGEYANWLEKNGRPMLAAGVQPGSGRSGASVGKDGMSTNSIEGDGYMDKSWKQMWNAIPAGYTAVKKELAGYMVDGKAKKGNKSENRATSELSSYADILGGVDAWPKPTAEVQKLGREGSKYDKELASYDDILSFPTAHPMHQALPVTDTRSKDTKVALEMKEAVDQLHSVDSKLHALSPSAGTGGADADRSDAKSLRCQECKDKWTHDAMLCAHRDCQRQLWTSDLEKQQVVLNNQLAQALEACLPQQQSYDTKVVVGSFVLPWTQPFEAAAHTWVRAVPAVQAQTGLGLIDGETTKLKLGGDNIDRKSVV